MIALQCIAVVEAIVICYLVGALLGARAKARAFEQLCDTWRADANYWQNQMMRRHEHDVHTTRYGNGPGY